MARAVPVPGVALAALAAVGLCAQTARGQEEGGASAERAEGSASAERAEGDASAASAGPRITDLERRLKELEESNARMREELDKLTGDQAFTEQRVEKLMPLSGRISGYLDIGFFHVGGNGSGIRTDVGNAVFPEYKDFVSGPWVFYGDPLSTAINSRGDPAETDESRAVLFDAVDNKGEASFIVNALNLTLFAGLGERLSLTSSIDFVPRGRDVSAAEPNDVSLGDYVDVKLAYAEYIVPVESFKLSLYAGKFDSVLGFEYRSREATDRLGVTPSLLCRYTCGAPLGLKARAQLFEGALTVNAAVTNGSHGTEGFPIHDEVDSNAFKTAAMRISSRAPVGAGLEVGVSGSIGAQDLQPDNSAYHWHYGVDAHLDWHDLIVTAEFLQGRVVGVSEPGQSPCNIAPCLRYKGAYGQVGYRLLNWLTPYARVDFRDALHQSGGSFVYISELLRVTGGLRLELGENVIIKAEYTVNRELGRIPQFPNDVFTSSMIVRH
jgi:hypothetical protein